MSQIKKPHEAESPYLSVVQAATYLGLKRQTMDIYRWAGGGPKYRKHGGRVLYKLDELDQWSDERAYQNTGQSIPICDQ